VRHELVLCSDDVHCDLILDDVPLTTAATLGDEIAKRSITLHSPSKTYNIAGLACAYAIIPDARLRAAFRNAGAGMLGEINNFGYVACEAAYRHGEPWRQALLAQLRANRDMLFDALRRGDLPGVTSTHVEATYLAWLNVEALQIEEPHKFFEGAGVGLSDGAAFGDARYVRLNFGCPASTLREAIARLSHALKARASASS
jgi:cystathionine beta-lyase